MATQTPQPENVRRSAAPDTAIQDGGRGPCAETLRPALRSRNVSSTAAPTLQNSTPSPADEVPYKAAPPPTFQEEYSGAWARTSPSVLSLKDKTRLCFWTEPGLVLLAQRTPGRRTVVGSHLKGSVTLFFKNTSIVCLKYLLLGSLMFQLQLTLISSKNFPEVHRFRFGR